MEADANLSVNSELRNNSLVHTACLWPALCLWGPFSCPLSCTLLGAQPRPLSYHFCPQTMGPGSDQHSPVTRGPTHRSFSSQWEGARSGRDMAGWLDLTISSVCSGMCLTFVHARGGIFPGCHHWAAASRKPTKQKGLPQAGL